MIIIGILVALFIIFFLLKKHVGTAILASFAGAIVYNTINGFFITIHNSFHIPLDIVESVTFFILVVALPFLVYFFSKRSWSPVAIRVLGSAVFAILLVSLCSGVISHIVSLDALSNNILGFVNGNRSIITTIGIVIAYFDVLLPHKDYS